MELNGFYNMDCIEGMSKIPDKYFQLAIVDPPYGGTEEETKAERRGGDWAAKYGEHIKEWDIAPKPEYFTELFRISENQVIWGGNYFRLPPTRCFLIWRKPTMSETFSMAMCEYAWTSFRENAKVFEYAPHAQKGETRIHPTQKPIPLYEWILSRYAKPGDRIIDTHVGSGSSLIACHNAGYEYMGFEIDEHYFRAAQERIEDAKAQMSLF